MSEEFQIEKEEIIQVIESEIHETITGSGWIAGFQIKNVKEDGTFEVHIRDDETQTEGNLRLRISVELVDG